jgi:hypothetical protein
MTNKQPSEKAMAKARRVCNCMHGQAWGCETCGRETCAPCLRIARALDDCAEAARREMLDRIRASLRDYPGAGGDIEVMASVGVIEEKAREAARREERERFGHVCEPECRHVTRAAYEGMIAEDVEWLRKQPRSLEREHIEAVLACSADREYGRDAIAARRRP